MRAGPLRHRIELQSQSSAPNGIGESILTWATDDTVWASVAPKGGTERYRENKESAEVTHKIRLRYYPGLNPAMRIKFGARIFDIQTVINFEERNIDMEVLAIEQVP